MRPIHLLCCGLLLAGIGAGMFGLRSHPDGLVQQIAVLDGPVNVAAVAEQAGRLFVTHDGGPTHGELTVIDASSGAALQEMRLPGPATSIAIDERTGHVFIVSTGASAGSIAPTDTLSMVSTTTGGLLRQIATCPGAALGAVDERAGRIFVLCTTYFAELHPPRTPLAPNAGLVVLDARNARVVAVVDTYGMPDGIVVDQHGGRAIVSSHNRSTGDGYRVTIDTQTGRILEAGPAKHRTVVATAPALTPAAPDALRESTVLDARDRRFIVAALKPSSSQLSGQLRLSILNAGDGRLIRTISEGDSSLIFSRVPASMALDQRRAHLFVTNTGDVTFDASGGAHPRGNAGLSVLDAASGHLLHRLPLSGIPVATLIDERSGRAFVVSDDPPSPATSGAPGKDTWTWLPRWIRSWLPFTTPPQTTAREDSTVLMLDTAL